MSLVEWKPNKWGMHLTSKACLMVWLQFVSRKKHALPLSSILTNQSMNREIYLRRPLCNKLFKMINKIIFLNLTLMTIRKNSRLLTQFLDAEARLHPQFCWLKMWSPGNLLFPASWHPIFTLVWCSPKILEQQQVINGFNRSSKKP